jgi:succinate-semialdehyde dehydrogenase / glutarate-semialdehyde dehydrogenase
LEKQHNKNTMSIQTVNPNTNKVVKSFEEMSDKAVDAALSQAASAYTYKCSY